MKSQNSSVFLATSLQRYHLADPGLTQLTVIVRGADTGRPELAPQAAGLLAVSAFRPYSRMIACCCSMGWSFTTRSTTLLHGGFTRRVLTSRRLRSCYSSESRTLELVHPVGGLDGNCNFSRTTGIVA